MRIGVLTGSLVVLIVALLLAATALAEEPSVESAGSPPAHSRWSSSSWRTDGGRPHRVTSTTAPGSVPGVGLAPAATTAAPATIEVETSGPQAITLAFGGDILPHMPLNDRAAANGTDGGAAYDYRPMFAPLAPVLSEVDVAVCHMEVPLAPPGERVSSYPSFGAPAEMVDAIASAGYDGCTTASNHSLDRGRAGLDHLLDRFDAAGILHNGTARTAEEGGGRATVYEVDGIRVANLSYAYDFNGYRIPADAPWSVNQIDVAAISEAASLARREGADLVVLSLHWGDEYVHEPSRYQRDVAEALLPSDDIDLVIGHHAHVVQPIEVVEGTPVVFGLGNQISNQSQPPRRDGLTVKVRAEPDAHGTWSVVEVEAVPTYVDRPGYRILPVVQTLEDPGLPHGLRAELQASYDRTAAVLAVDDVAWLVRLEPSP